jgi:hypothetical protein
MASNNYTGFTTGNDYYDFSKDNLSPTGFNALNQNYMLALSNLQKIEMDISYCLSNQTTTTGETIPYRQFTFADGGRLDLSNNTPQVIGGTANGSNQIHFTQGFRNSTLGQCNSLYNNSTTTDVPNGGTIPHSTAWPSMNQGLYDYIYHDFIAAKDALSAYRVPENMPQYELMDKAQIDASYQMLTQLRNHLDTKMLDLYNTDNSIPHLFSRQFDSTIFITILWTILAVSLLYYVFMKL